jgi:hypothetical protein
MTTTITKSGYALTNGNDFAFIFTGKTPQGNIKTIPATETFEYELIISSSTKTDKTTGELLDNISLGTITVTLSPDGKTYTHTHPRNIRKIFVFSKSLRFLFSFFSPPFNGAVRKATYQHYAHNILRRRARFTCTLRNFFTYTLYKHVYGEALLSSPLIPSPPLYMYIRLPDFQERSP